MEWCFFDCAKSLWLDTSSYADFLQALQTSFPCFPFLAYVVRNHYIRAMHDVIQTLKKPSPLQEKWTCQPKRIISWTYNRKHAWSCHWLIFQINLELYYIILSIPENPQCSFNGRLPVKSLSFAPSLLSASEIWNNISFLFLMNFVYLNPPFLHRSLTSWISVRASLMMVLILAHHPHKNFSGGY